MRSVVLPGRRTAKAPFSAMAPAIGHVAGEDLGPAGRASGDGDHAQPGVGGARDGVVGGGHEHAAVRERVVDVAEDAAQPRRQRRQLSKSTSRRRSYQKW